MIVQIISLALLVVSTQAGNYGHFGSVQSIPAAPSYSYASPVQGYPAQSYSSISHVAPTGHYPASVPQIAQYATPVPRIAQYAAPVHQVSHYSVPTFQQSYQASPLLTRTSPAPSQYATSYSSLNLGQSLPSAHYAGPAQGYYSAPAQNYYTAPVAQYRSPVAYQQRPVAYSESPSHYDQEEYTPAKYEFGYGVADPQTGDMHSHKEAREGDFTVGEYSVQEPDGSLRTVKYTVDKNSGFNAVVEKSGQAQHAQPAHGVIAAPHGYHH